MKPPLTLIEGGRNRAEVIVLERAHYEELRVELAVSLAERALAAYNERGLVRAALRSLRDGHTSAAALRLTELAKSIEREATRAGAAAAAMRDHDREPTGGAVPAGAPKAAEARVRRAA